MCRPKGYGFCMCRFGLTGYKLCSTGYAFQGNYGSLYKRIYCFNNSKSVRKKEKYANSKWILRNLFCCCSNLSNQGNKGIISERPGLRTGMKFRGQVWKQVWKMTLWNRIRIWRTGWHTPTKNSQEYPPGLSGKASLGVWSCLPPNHPKSVGIDALWTGASFWSCCS